MDVLFIETARDRFKKMHPVRCCCMIVQTVNRNGSKTVPITCDFGFRSNSRPVSYNSRSPFQNALIGWFYKAFCG